MNLTDRLRKARINLIADLPFFGSLAFKLKTHITTEIDTACVDGVTLKISPDYAAKLTEPQLAGLLVEEIGHCAMGHLWRKGSRDHQIWNQACDQTLWETICKLTPATDGRVALSPDCQWNSQYANLSAEEIYHLMQQDGSAKPDYQSPGQFTSPENNPNPSDPSDPSDPSNSPGNSPGNQPGNQPGDSPGDSPGNTPSDLENEWKLAVTQAATVERQRGQGKLPAWIEQLVQECTEPRVPWTEHVREFCHRLTRDDYSFRRPNRRFLQHGFILPSLHSETLGPIVGGFDTSGSIFGMDKLIADILSEFQGVLDLCRPEKMILIDCDTRVHQTAEFLPGDDLRQFRPQGGGGTDFRPVFDAIAQLPEPPACLIFLTDLEGRFPDTPPEYPVLWANFGHPRTTAPFGTTIQVPLP